MNTQMDAQIEPVIDATVDGVPQAYIHGRCVVAYDHEQSAWHVIYTPRKSAGKTPAPSFSHFMVF